MKDLKPGMMFVTHRRSVIDLIISVDVGEDGEISMSLMRSEKGVTNLVFFDREFDYSVYHPDYWVCIA